MRLRPDGKACGAGGIMAWERAPASVGRCRATARGKRRKGAAGRLLLRNCTLEYLAGVVINECEAEGVKLPRFGGG